MIIQIRKKLQSRIFKAFLSIVMLLMMLPLSVNEIIKYMGSSKAWVVSVNGNKIYPEDVAKKAAKYEMEIKSIRNQYPEFADMILQYQGLNRDPREMALDSLVQNKLVDGAVHALHLNVGTDVIGKNLGEVDERTLRNYLQQIGMSPEQFVAQQKEELGRATFYDLLRRSSYVPYFVAQERYVTNYLGKKFSIVPFMFADYLKKEEAKGVTEQELKAFYDLQNDRFKRYFVPEKRTGTVLRFDPAHFGISVTQAEIERYYKNHQAEFKDAPLQVQVRRILFATDAENPELRAKAEKIHAQLVAQPATFAAVAKEHSQDEKTAKDGGLMDHFAQGTHDRDFEKAAFLLQNNNDISGVINTKAGYEIIQRVDKKAATFKPLADVQTDIKTKLLQEKFNTDFALQARALLEKAKADTSALAQFAEQKKAKKQSVTVATNQNTPVAQAMARLPLNGSSSFMEGDLGVIVQLHSIEKAHLPSLESIKATVKQDLLQERAQQALQKAVQDDLAQAKGKKLAEFNSLFAGRVEHTPLVKASDTQEVQKLKDRGISAIDLFQLEKVGSVVASGVGQNRFIVRLDEVEKMNSAEFSAHQAEIIDKANQEESQAAFEGFVASLYRNATIKQN